MLLQLQDAVTEIQREKFDLQKKHLEDVQELLGDSNHRLAKMEAEYNAQSQTTVSTVDVHNMQNMYMCKFITMKAFCLAFFF